MNRRFATVFFAVVMVVLALLVVFFVVRNNPPPVESVEKEGISITEEPPMTLAPPANTSTYSETQVINLLSLKYYEMATKGDFLSCEGNAKCLKEIALSLCKEDIECFKEVIAIVGARCIDETCNDPNSIKNPLDCFISPSGTRDIITGNQEKIASSLCVVFRSSDDPLTRKEFLRHASSDPYVTENELVEFMAHVKALKVSGEECINYIKNYVGPYDHPQWRFRWYKILAGCRILSKEISRREQEENLTIWYRWGFCPEITDPELRKACEAVAGNLTIEEGRFSNPELHKFIESGGKEDHHRNR